jgi:hypothetical protein
MKEDSRKGINICLHHYACIHTHTHTHIQKKLCDWSESSVLDDGGHTQGQQHSNITPTSLPGSVTATTNEEDVHTAIQSKGDELTNRIKNNTRVSSSLFSPKHLQQANANTSVTLLAVTSFKSHSPTQPHTARQHPHMDGSIGKAVWRQERRCSEEAERVLCGQATRMMEGHAQNYNDPNTEKLHAMSYESPTFRTRQHRGSLLSREALMGSPSLAHSKSHLRQQHSKREATVRGLPYFDDEGLNSNSTELYASGIPQPTQSQNKQRERAQYRKPTSLPSSRLHSSSMARLSLQDDLQLHTPHLQQDTMAGRPAHTGPFDGGVEARHCWFTTLKGSDMQVRRRLTDGSVTHSLTHSLTHGVTHALTHSLTHSLTHGLTHALTHSITLMQANMHVHVLLNRILQHVYTLVMVKLPWDSVCAA